MSDLYIKKKGLLYSPDSRTIIGVDDTSSEFTGKVPYGAKSIDDEVFSECPYESVSLPDSLNSLGKGLFKDSKVLEKVKLPLLITELPADLFSGCSALRSVKMPNSLSGFPEGLFCNCKSLTDIPFRAGIKVLKKNVFFGCTSLKSLVIPNTVTDVEEGAVANCTALESVVFPSCIESIAEGAFAGCCSLHNIRINGDSELFYVKEDDGCLYKKTEGDGEDKLVVKSYKVDPASVYYFEENVDDKPVEECDEDESEYSDSIFSPEIGASDEEIEIVGFSDEFEEENLKETVSEDSETADSHNENIEKENTNKDENEGEIMNDEKDVDSMLADIMGEEKERIAAAGDVGISDKESEVLSETMSVMEDSPVSSNQGTVSDEELANLFSKNEEQEMAAQKSEEDKKDSGEFDSKTKILIDSVEQNKILNFQANKGAETDSDLFVIAEKLVDGENGEKLFSSRLETCCSKLALIHDFSRVIMLHGLPVDNDEFMQFYKNFIGKKNIIVACEADKVSTLSDYCKTVCDCSRISLDKDELIQQRRSASIKTDTLLKLIVRDKYDE